MTDDEIDPADAQVTVSVLHGSFDGAGYALMIGVYADEEMSGAERFLDRQFGQLLSGWQDLGHYPGPLGTSVFVEPGRDVGEGCEPVGAYLVGLGSSLTLGPRQLRSAVYRALVDRCLRAYPPAAGDSGETGQAHSAPTLVGVSTALLGVRDDQGLRIEDSVTAILEGVRDVNRRLAEYEQERGSRSSVRAAHVQFVERYAHRADLAATAVRHARSTATLPDSFSGLEDVCVEPGVGALPAGAALLEQDRPWVRFAVTERPRPAPATTGGDGLGSSTIEVTALGRDARADRATHQIDRASLDDLTSRLTLDQSNPEALTALRDRLIPYDLRSEFLSSAALQLVLDDHTANYSWEQFAAPAPGAPGGIQAPDIGSILRVFTESEDRRLEPVRATVGTALVIGAGNSVPGVPLPGAVDEAAAVGALLNGSRIATRVLVDDLQAISVSDLNIALLGDHQILHLAGHGTHVEGDAEATGVHLAPGFRFTADVVDSMPVVPELVVLNSCYNARIGLNRLAAGLARSLMRIGVRAVVAAGWPIADTAAKTFAVTFYAGMLAGRTFGDAVRHARRMTAGYGGTTWAAYQCYGDPTFVLRGLTTGLDRVGAPVSLNDLRTRIETLLTQIADLSRPRPGTVTSRRDQLVERFVQLEGWAAPYHPARHPDLREGLAQAARELGRFDRAAHWYTTFASASSGQPRRPADRNVSAHHLQQAANCTARDVQQRVRAADDAAAAVPLDDFAAAQALAEGARAVLDDDEGAAILASVYKKWATAVPAGRRREQLLDRAVGAYDRITSSTRGDYGVENRIQVIALRDRARARQELAGLRPARRPAHSAGTRRPTRILIDAAPARGADFWARVAAGDRELTAAMTGASAGVRRRAADRMVTVYRDAFRRRSTFAERYSAIDHLQDLHDLLPDADDRKPLLRDALDRLAPWSRFTPQEPAIASPAPVRTAVITSGARGSATVTVTAVHAACGDCLLLDYIGDDGVAHRILVDGGLGSAFGSGLGRVLGPPGSPTVVDVAVVTHIDGDHIAGVIQALREKRLTADDYWFNGRDQISQPDEPAATRSVTQGDALSRLIPDDRRNRVVDGRALVVPASGPPELALPGGATAVLLSPSPPRLTKLLAGWPEPTRGGDDLEALLRAFDVDLERGQGEMGRDGSVPNGASIAFLFEHDGASVLFTADAWASELVQSITALLAARNATRQTARPGAPPLTALPVQLFKLSHHGSRQNVTDALLDLIDPRQILICTDGSKFKHPDPDTLDLLRRHYPGVPVLFTDATPVVEEHARQVGGSVPSSSPVVIEL
ncbi:MAG: CHAT domain-containing protein [Kineosporiaceae bacterium]